MQQKTLLFITGLLISMLGMAQQNTESVFVFQGNIDVGNSGEKFSHYFAKGDQVEIEFSTEKDKDLKSVAFSKMNGEKLWDLEDKPSGNQKIQIKEEGVYTLKLEGKFLGSRLVRLDISRTPDSPAKRLLNTAWEMEQFYDSALVEYQIDSVIGGYNDTVVGIDTFEIFDRYLYQKIPAFDTEKQLLGQYGAHKSQAAAYRLKNEKVTSLPTKDAFFDHYYRTLNSKMGGKSHWDLARIGVTAGAMFLSPAGAFAANGAMGVVGPQPGNEPVQYFMSYDKSDINRVKEIYSPSGKAKNFVNMLANKDQLNEGDLTFDQKGKVTNLYFKDSGWPASDWLIIANPDRAQAKNTKLSAGTVWGAPVYNRVMAEKTFYRLKKTKVNRSKMKYTRKSVPVRVQD
ncbi:hypothetical protein [Marinilabilia sp.]